MKNNNYCKESKRTLNKIYKRLQKYCGFCFDISQLILEFINTDGLNSLPLYKPITNKNLLSLKPKLLHANYKFMIGTEFFLNKTIEIYGISINENLSSYISYLILNEYQNGKIINHYIFNIYKQKKYEKNITMNPIWNENDTTIYVCKHKKTNKIQKIHLKKQNKKYKCKNHYKYRIGFKCKDGVSFNKYTNTNKSYKIIGENKLIKYIEYKWFDNDLNDIYYGLFSKNFKEKLDWFPRIRLLMS